MSGYDSNKLKLFSERKSSTADSSRDRILFLFFVFTFSHNRIREKPIQCAFETVVNKNHNGRLQPEKTKTEKK